MADIIKNKVCFNFHWDYHVFYIPDIKEGKKWEVLFDTSDEVAKKIDNGKIKMAPRSIVVLKSVTERTLNRMV